MTLFLSMARFHQGALHELHTIELENVRPRSIFGEPQCQRCYSKSYLDVYDYDSTPQMFAIFAC